MSTLYQLWRFENGLDPGQSEDGFDRVYIPQVGYITGDAYSNKRVSQAVGRRGGCISAQETHFCDGHHSAGTAATIELGLPPQFVERRPQ